jgi:hypothetical protein
MVARIALVSAATVYVSAGRSILVRIRASDAADNSPLGATLLHVALGSGDATFDGSSKAVDAVTGSDGVLELHIRPGATAGRLVVHLTLGEQTQDIELRLLRQPAKALVVGLATVGLGSVPGSIESPDDAANGTLSRRGAVSIYGSGSVAPGTNATIAYRSADTLDQGNATGPFVDDPNDRPFPTYGDASTQSDDALSRDRLFASVENGASSAMWGEFYAQAGVPDAAGGYNFLVNGARIQTQGTVAGGGAFYARDDIAFDRAVFTPSGLGIANRVLRPDIVVGSDIVTLVSLDRRTGAIVAQRLLGRGTDYVLDYATGLLRFVNILLPYDDELNPQVVTVQYEYGGPAADSSIDGANASLRLSRAAGGDVPRLDGWYLNDSSGIGNLSLFGESLRGGPPDASWSISHEHSSGIAPVSTAAYGTEGDRYRASLTTHDGPLTFDLHFDTTGAGYANPYGAYATPGLLSLNVDASRRLSRITTLDFTFLTAKNDLPNTAAGPAVSNADTQARIALHVTPSSRLRYHLGVVDEAANGNGVTSPVAAFDTGGTVPTPSSDPLTFPANLATVDYTAGSGHGLLLQSGIAWEFVKRWTLSLDEGTPLSKTTDPYDPPGTDAALEVALGANGKAFVRQHWADASSDVLAATQQITAFSGTARTSTTAGFEQEIGTTTVESGYSVDHTENGTDLYEALGARRTVALGPRLSGDAFAQVGRVFESTGLPAQASETPDFLVFGTSLSYGTKAFRATSQVQVRTGFNSGSTFLLGATGPLTPSISVFGSMSASYTQDYDTSTVRAGLSYRPAENDRAVTLFSIDSQTGNLTNYDDYVTNVAQLAELYRPSRRTEFGASLAYKITGDQTFAPRTLIYGLRGDQRIGPRFDIGAELHRSGTEPLDGAQATGLAIEGGYRIGDNLRVAGGYNFSGFTDPAVATSPTHRGFYATLSSYVDNLFGWGK